MGEDGVLGSGGFGCQYGYRPSRLVCRERSALSEGGQDIESAESRGLWEGMEREEACS